MISIIGVGRVGADTAVQLGLMRLDKEIVLIDIIQGLPQGEALDLNHMSAILGLDVEYRGSNDYRDIAGSDIVVVTAGFPRKPGMTREELVGKNAGIVRDIGKAIKEYAPNAVIVMTTNPLDAMTYLMYKVTGFPRERVIGFSGVLDSGRLAFYAAKKLGVSTTAIQPVVLGQHGEKMVPVPRLSFVYGKPLTELLPKEAIDEIVKSTIQAGAEITKLRGFSSNHAPAAGVALMVESIKKDLKRIFISSVVLKGEYGFEDIPMEVPVVLGRGGVERIIELDLNDEEKRLLRESAEAIRKNISEIPKEYFS